MGATRDVEHFLHVAVQDPAVRARYAALVSRTTTRRGCRVWMGALSQGGHGRFWLGVDPVTGADVAVIAHRFGYAIAHGTDALVTAQVVKHLCDEPSCQEPTHLLGGTVAQNTWEWNNRRHLIGSPLRDTRGPAARARALRDAARAGTDLDAAADAGSPQVDAHQDALFPGDPATVVDATTASTTHHDTPAHTTHPKAQ